MNSAWDVVVLGGGISGLTAGFLLHREGFRTLVVEGSDRPGGCITTWRDKGFLFELGPNTVLNNALEIDDLCQRAGLLQERIQAAPAAGKRFVVKDGRLVPLPGGPLGFLTTPLFSPSAKLRLLKEPFIRRGPEGVEESIAAFVRRRLGEEFLHYAVGPFVSGVYAGDPERLSVEHAVAKIYALERDHGSLIRGALAKRKGPAPAGGLFSFPDGLATLPETLARALGDRFLPGTEAVSATPDEGGYAVETAGSTRGVLRTRSVISALPAEAASRVLTPLEGSFAKAISRLPYADVALVSLGFRREDVGFPLDGFGFLVPEVEGRHLLGCLFPSSLFPGRAPEGHVALSAFVGGAVHPERVAKAEEVILKDVLEDLRPLLSLSGDPVLSKVTAWRPAIPQYNVGHGAFKQAARESEDLNPGFLVSGNLLHGVSVGNCIQNATATAERAARHLRE